MSEISKASDAPEKAALPNCWMAQMDNIEASVEYLCTECDPQYARATQIVANIRKAVFDELGNVFILIFKKCAKNKLKVGVKFLTKFSIHMLHIICRMFLLVRKPSECR